MSAVSYNSMVVREAKKIKLPTYQSAFVAVVHGGRNHMRISSNDSHNMKTNNGYARKACGGFYKMT